MNLYLKSELLALFNKHIVGVEVDFGRFVVDVRQADLQHCGNY